MAEKSTTNRKSAQAARSSVKKQKKRVAEGIAYIKASFNNTLITIADLKGNVIGWSSAAKVGFKGARKSTPFAGQVAADEIAKHCIDNFQLKSLHVKVRGPGPGRESSIKSLEAAGIRILSIEDVTGIPHNGCRDPKKRRV